jgi:hypothetical protein
LRLLHDQTCAPDARCIYCRTREAVRARNVQELPDGHPKQCSSPNCKIRQKAHLLCMRHLSQLLRGTFTGLPDADDRRDTGAWLIPDDGIIDDVAVDVAARGQRLVCLTRTERKLAARRILAEGGTYAQVARNLGCGKDMASALVRELTREVEAALRWTLSRWAGNVPFRAKAA